LNERAEGEIFTYPQHPLATANFLNWLRMPFTAQLKSTIVKRVAMSQSVGIQNMYCKKIDTKVIPPHLDRSS